MADSRTPRRPYTELNPESYSRTLAQRLAGPRLVDPLRNLVSRFGLRHYEVRIVRLKWSGGRRGEGEPAVEREFKILPTPRVLGMDELDESVEGPGVQEIGMITIDRISTTYSEEDLRGLLRGEREHPIDVEAFYEVTHFGQAGAARRRFNLAKVPRRKTLGWNVQVVRDDNDRDSATRDPPLSKRDNDTQEVPK